jgi:hypothetical protein
MPSLDEIKRALEGAWLIARRDPGAMSRFDLTVDGFWASFFAAVVAAPGYFFLVADDYARRGPGAHLGEVVLIEVLAYAVVWIAFPVMALLLTQALGLGQRYVPLVVAANWGSVLQVALLVAVTLVGGLLPEGAGTVLKLTAKLLALVYQWLVIRTALETTGLVATGFIAVDILLSEMIRLGADGFIQAG